VTESVVACPAVIVRDAGCVVIAGAVQVVPVGTPLTTVPFP